jgi:hypothetical protein
MNTFKDESIFADIKEFLSPRGRIRAIYQGSNIYHIYLYDNDGNAFIYDVSISCKKNASPRKIYNLYLDAGWAEFEQGAHA